MNQPTIQEYQPEMWTVRKDNIYAVIYALEAGLANTQDALTRHESELGRTTRKNEMWAKQLERDIDAIRLSIARLRKYGPVTMPA